MGAGTLVLASLLWSVGQAPAPAPIAPVYMKSRSIRIPINIKAERRAEIRDLLLYVSTDMGRTWSQEARATPDRGSFNYTAPQDGILWFSVSTIFTNGKREPDDINQVPPGLVVLVDSQPPIVQIKRAERIGEELEVEWAIQEANPNAETLRLEFRAAGADTAPWTPVSISPGPIGKVRFRCGAGPQLVRMTLQDLAGNQAMAMKPANGADTASTSAFGGGQVVPVATPPMPSGPPILPVPPDPTPGPAIASATTPRPDPIGNERPLQTNPLPPITGVTRTDAPRGDEFTRPRDVPAPAPAPVASNFPQPVATPRTELKNTTLVNSKQITLTYDVLKAGPSGVRRAILYVTDNDGQTWTQGGLDESQTRRVTANLPGEGTFGFRVVLESGAGLSKGSPQGGEQPEMRVEVDLTPPSVELYAPAPDPNQRDTLILRWTATDKNLASNLIDLEYSESETGNWTKIASVPNSGVHSWKLPPKMPYRVYLRVVARDLAGNVGEARTPQPQLIDLHKPEGVISTISGTTVQIRQ